MKSFFNGRLSSIAKGSFGGKKDDSIVSTAKRALLIKIAAILAPILGYAILGVVAVAIVVSVIATVLAPFDAAIASLTGSNKNPSLEKAQQSLEGSSIDGEKLGLSPEAAERCITSMGADTQSIGRTVAELGDDVDPQFVVDYTAYTASFVPLQQPPLPPPVADDNEETPPEDSVDDTETVAPRPAQEEQLVEDPPVDDQFISPDDAGTETPPAPEAPEEVDPTVTKVSAEEYATLWKEAPTRGLAFLHIMRPGIPEDSAELIYMLAQRAVATSGDYPDYQGPDTYKIAKMCGQVFGKPGR